MLQANSESKQKTLPQPFSYTSTPVQRHRIEDATIAVRTFGQGPVVILIHGFPLHGYTWRMLLPTLSEHFTCHVVDLPGLGDSDWDATTEFTFGAQARRLLQLFDALQLKEYSLLAHDTGGTVARLIALQDPERARKLALINTEIPGYRPPWLPLYQQLLDLPGAANLFQWMLRSDRFVHSSLGFKAFYSDAVKRRAPDNLAHYLQPLIGSTRRVKGAVKYLQGVEWPVVDALQQRHREIRADVLFLWGERDTTFPVLLAEAMCAQFRQHPTFIRIPQASLLPHEEKPEDVLRYLIPFLKQREGDDILTRSAFKDHNLASAF